MIDNLLFDIRQWGDIGGYKMYGMFYSNHVVTAFKNMDKHMDGVLKIGIPNFKMKYEDQY